MAGRLKLTAAVICILLSVILADSGTPNIKTFHFSNVLELGMRESVQCTVISGDPPYEFTWFKDGRPLVDLRDVSVRKSDDFMSTLVITKVNADSNGNYTCRVSNSAGYDEKSAVLSVKESGVPKINPFHFSGELDVGMRASVQCAVIYGDPPFEFSWSKDGHKLMDARGVSVRTFDDFTSTLVISKVDADSNGNYSCKAANSKGFDEKAALLLVKDEGIPKIGPFHFHGDLVVGMRTSVLCAVIFGDPPFEFSWSKDGHKLSEVRSISVKNIDDFTSNLAISKVDADSNGNYTCRASNSKGFDEKSALLSVKELGAPKVNPFNFFGELDVGMRASVHCAVIYGDIPFEFMWLKDGQPLADSRGISFRKTDEYTSNLVISKVDADSNGNYTCRVTNSKGSDERSAVLSVKGPGEPKIKSFHFSNELELGMRESVHCNVLYGDTPFEFAWFKDGQSLMEARGISVRKTDDYNSNLVILKVDADSNGNYTCRASNSKGFDEKSAMLSVKDSGEPKIKAFHFSNDLELGMRESVQCTVKSGDPPFEFSWYKDGLTLVDMRDISVHKTDNFMSTLVISKVNSDSNGNYTCRVSNKVGFDEKSAILSVKGEWLHACVFEIVQQNLVLCLVKYRNSF
ncbi:titin [Nephila pilipes]|uniref:Titin n=1 Tax=Nephila pilipes TaxID=299642 RepID=A0A8X6UHX1_NEPPI|nr:titin [Nephila pilipes]